MLILKNGFQNDFGLFPIKVYVYSILVYCIVICLPEYLRYDDLKTEKCLFNVNSNL